MPTKIADKSGNTPFIQTALTHFLEKKSGVLVLLFFGPSVPFLAVSDPFLIQKHLFLALFGRELGDLEKIFHGYVSDGQERGGELYRYGPIRKNSI